MTRKRKRRSSVVEIGTGPARVKTYTVNRKDGYPMYSLYWQEGGQRQVRHLACQEEARLNLKKFTDRVRGNITDITTADINRFLGGLEGLGPVSRNTIRRNLITMFGFAKKQGYLHPDRKTSAELSETFKEPDTGIEIFTPKMVFRHYREVVDAESAKTWFSIDSENRSSG